MDTPDGTYAGQSRKPFEHLLEENPSPCARIVTTVGKRRPQDENIPGVETEVHMPEREERAHHQARASQEEKRKRHLEDHESGAEFPMPESPARSSSRSCEPGVKVPVDGMERGCQAAEKRRENCHAESKA